MPFHVPLRVTEQLGGHQIAAVETFCGILPDLRLGLPTARQRVFSASEMAAEEAALAPENASSGCRAETPWPWRSTSH